MSEARSRKKAGKKVSPSPGEEKKATNKGESLQSFSAALEGLRKEVTEDKTLLATYEHLLQSELNKRVPSFSCHLLALCKLILKFFWLLFLLLIVVGMVIYNVEKWSDAVAVFMQEHMYETMRVFRFGVLALCPYIPRLLKPCLIVNPFSPAAKCACLDGVVISNASIAAPFIDDTSIIFHPQLINFAQRGPIDAYELRNLYYKGHSLQDPCAEFSSESEDSPDDVYYHDLFMSMTDMRQYLQSKRVWKANWQECSDNPNSSIMKLLPKFPLPPGYKLASGPMIFLGRQWARFYHIPELWDDIQNLLLFITIHGEMKLSVDSSYDCIDHCPAAHGVQIMKEGDAILLHEKHWSPNVQTWSKDHTIMMAIALMKDGT